jgi:hypothetical protein
MNERDYYESQLGYLEYLQLDLIGELLFTEIDVYETRKILLRERELGMADDPDVNGLNAWYLGKKIEHGQIAEKLDDIELDLSHVRFMLNRLNNESDEQGG